MSLQHIFALFLFIMEDDDLQKFCNFPISGWTNGFEYFTICKCVYRISLSCARVQNLILANDNMNSTYIGACLQMERVLTQIMYNAFSFSYPGCLGQDVAGTTGHSISRWVFTVLDCTQVTT